MSLAVTIDLLFVMQAGWSRQLTFAEGTEIGESEDGACLGTNVAETRMYIVMFMFRGAHGGVGCAAVLIWHLRMCKSLPVVALLVGQRLPRSKKNSL